MLFKLTKKEDFTMYVIDIAILCSPIKCPCGHVCLSLRGIGPPSAPMGPIPRTALRLLHRWSLQWIPPVNNRLITYNDELWHANINKGLW